MHHVLYLPPCQGGIKGGLTESQEVCSDSPTVSSIHPSTHPYIHPPSYANVTVDITPGSGAHKFFPYSALGAGIDGQEKGDISTTFTPANIKAMLTAGFKPVTYRLRTELGMEAWHWNPQGTWSDPAHQQGYWTSSSIPGAPISICNGYSLPRRGNTGDQANNKGYSRLDDGDPATFWKSNPYLDRHFTGEDNALHPQWVVIDLGQVRSVNAIQIKWGVPFATRYRIEYWHGPDDEGYLDSGGWQVFPGGDVQHGVGGQNWSRLSHVPISVQYVKIIMTASSGRAPAGSTDIRDGLGYAIRELGVGSIDARGIIQDYIRHYPGSSGQTKIYTSSTDPWHRAADRDENVEQPGFDRFYRSGITNGLPALIPAAVFYDTPPNAAAELRYLKARGYPVAALELGEEPDGQYVTPEDFAELYRQCAERLHKIDAGLRLGGPSFQNADVDVLDWPERAQKLTWAGRMVHYLHSHGMPQEPGFVSFEWYPFERPCDPPAPHLMEEPQILAKTVKRLRGSGINPATPLLITEYGYSAYGAEEEDDLPGALFNAEVSAQFLLLGGATSYLYGYEPNTLIHETECQPAGLAWGQNMLFLADDDRHTRSPMPTYYAARLLNEQWLQPGNGLHTIYAAASGLRNGKAQPIVTAYAVQRPDLLWAILLLNKDPKQVHTVQLQFQNGADHTARHLTDAVDLYQYGPAQYRWQPDGEHGHPSRDLPPTHARIPAKSTQSLPLPPYSITILRGVIDNG